MYNVETRVLNQAVKRNLGRFPGDDFMFELTIEELASLRSQTVILEKKGAHSKYLPTAFGEMGIAMLASVIRSEAAITISIQIMRAFVEMRKFLSYNANVFTRLENVERKQLKADENFEKIFDALESNDLKPKQS